MLFDPGLQPERTLLAWRRTCLAFGGASALAARLLLDELRLAAIVVGVCGLVVSAAAYLAAEAHHRRSIERFAAGAEPVGDGLHNGLLVGAAAVVIVAGIGYLALRTMARA
jgi:uncharacterized membrane protein YidH (DUF202 family)